MVFKNKEQLINFINHQTNVELVNDQEHCLNRKSKLLYTEISGVYKNSVLRLMNKYGIKYESHHKDNFWVYVK